MKKYLLILVILAGLGTGGVVAFKYLESEMPKGFEKFSIGMDQEEGISAFMEKTEGMKRHAIFFSESKEGIKVEEVKDRMDVNLGVTKYDRDTLTLHTDYQRSEERSFTILNVTFYKGRMTRLWIGIKSGESGEFEKLKHKVLSKYGSTSNVDEGDGKITWTYCDRNRQIGLRNRTKGVVLEIRKFTCTNI